MGGCGILIPPLCVVSCGREDLLAGEALDGCHSVWETLKERRKQEDYGWFTGLIRKERIALLSKGIS